MRKHIFKYHACLIMISPIFLNSACLDLGSTTVTKQSTTPDAAVIAPECFSNSDCADSEQCQAGICQLVNNQSSDECRQTSDCEPSFNCVSGRCEQMDYFFECRVQADCAANENCVNGTCTHACHLLEGPNTCPINHQCIDGVCIPLDNGPSDIKCTSTQECPPAFICDSGACVPSNK